MNSRTNLYAYALTQRNVLLTDRLAHLLRGLAQLAVEAYQSYRTARNERAAIGYLRELDDRLLRDIGLTRDQIPAAVRGRALR